MLSTKDRLAQFQKGSNNPPAANAPKLGQAGLKPVSKTNGGAAKPAESSVKPAEQPKAAPALAAKPNEPPKAVAPNPATQKQEPKPAEQAKTGAAAPAKPVEQPKPAVQPAKPADQKPVETTKAAEPKPVEGAKASELKPAEAAKPAAAKPAEQTKPAEQPKPAGLAKPIEQPKPAEQAKPAQPLKPAELPKPVEPAKPAEVPKPAQPSKPVEPAKAATQIAPAAVQQEPQKLAETTAKPETAAAPKPAEQPKPATAQNAAKPAEQPLPAEPAKLAEQPKPAVPQAQTVQPKQAVPPAQTAAKPAEQIKPVELVKIAEQPKPAVPQAQTVQPKAAEPAQQAAQQKPAEQPKSAEAVKQAVPAAAKAPQQSKAPAATVQVKPAEQKTVEAVVKTAQQPQTAAAAKPVEVAKPSEPGKTAELPKQQTDAAKSLETAAAKAQPNEAKPASSDELFANIFYFSGMGSLIGSALAEGIYVPEKNHRSALELEEIELSKKREETKHKHEIITTARTQAQGLYSDFQKLQALLESLPTFTDTLEPKPLERRAVDQPIHGHIYFQQEQPQRPQSPYHVRQPASQPAHSVPVVNSTVTRRQQTTTYTSSQVIHPTTNTTKIGLGKSPAEERSAISTIHVTETHHSGVESPLRDSAAHSPIVAGFDRLAAKQDALAKDAADRAAFNKSHGANVLDPGAIHYPTIEPRYHPHTPTKHEMHGVHYQQPALRSEAASVPGAHQQDAIKHHAGGGTLDTSDLKPWQLSHLRGLEVHGYHLESHVPHHFSPSQHTRPFQPAPFVPGPSSSDIPYCDL